MSKVLIELDPAYHSTFKRVVDKEFSAWEVNAFAPKVYVVPQGDHVSIFSIVGVKITEEDQKRLQDIATRIKQNPPTPEVVEYKFNPIKQPGRYKSKVSVKMGMGRAFKVGR